MYSGDQPGKIVILLLQINEISAGKATQEVYATFIEGFAQGEWP